MDVTNQRAKSISGQDVKPIWIRIHQAIYRYVQLLGKEAQESEKKVNSRISWKIDERESGLAVEILNHKTWIRR